MPPQLRRVKQTPKLPRRRRDGHKGEYGRVLVVGGSPGMIGAVALAANAALRGGAGTPPRPVFDGRPSGFEDPARPGVRGRPESCPSA